MPREMFERELHKLQDNVLLLGSMVEQAVLQSVEALRTRDFEASKRIYAADQQINEKRYSIEQDILTLMATQQPMARDLRFLAAILEINTELERIGDYAKGIAKINLLLGEGELVIPVTDLQTMAEKGLDMLRRALTAFVARDAQTAQQIPNEDDEVDSLYNQFVRELINFSLANPSNIDNANYLAWAAHNLERLADRVTNICERILFVVTGEMREFDVKNGLEIKR